MRKDKQHFYILKHGGLFIADRGLTTTEKYARRFSENDAIERQRRFEKDHTIVEMVEVADANQ